MIPGTSSPSRSFLVAALFSVLAASAQAAGLIMPIYGNTSSQFNAAVSAAQRVSMIAVINPDNGPGSSKVGGISNQVSRLRGAKATVAGYINSYYGGEPQSSVQTQIDRYKSWYGANAIYLDEMSDRTNKISYYKSIYTYAKGKGMTVVGNPGTFVPSGYAGVADVLVTFEDPYSRWGSVRKVSWAGSYPAGKFAAIVYAASSGVMKTVVDKAVSLKYGWIFVTDGSGGNPFGRAPGYLTAEADYVKKK
jgi:hypothetical protein